MLIADMVLSPVLARKMKAHLKKHGIKAKIMYVPNYFKGKLFGKKQPVYAIYVPNNQINVAKYLINQKFIKLGPFFSWYEINRYRKKYRNAYLGSISSNKGIYIYVEKANNINVQKNKSIRKKPIKENVSSKAVIKSNKKVLKEKKKIRGVLPLKKKMDKKKLLLIGGGLAAGTGLLALAITSGEGTA